MKSKINAVRERITRAAEGCGRAADSVQLVTVSKTMPIPVLETAIDAGVRLFGENYIQEAREKHTALGARDVQWHFIGHLQRNKAKYAVRIFDLIHSVDSLRLAEELDKQAGKSGKVQQILIQVNISREASKSGIREDEVLQLARDISGLEHIAVKGLMTMPPFFNAPEKVRPFFRQLKQLRDRIRSENIGGVDMDELSMGMTGDFETAIEEGATLVRIGTAIFGERH